MSQNAAKKLMENHIIELVWSTIEDDGNATIESTTY